MIDVRSAYEPDRPTAALRLLLPGGLWQRSRGTLSPSSFAAFPPVIVAFLRAEIAKWAKVVKEANIKIE